MQDSDGQQTGGAWKGRVNGSGLAATRKSVKDIPEEALFLELSLAGLF